MWRCTVCVCHLCLLHEQFNYFWELWPKWMERWLVGELVQGLLGSLASRLRGGMDGWLDGWVPLSKVLNLHQQCHSSVAGALEINVSFRICFTGGLVLSAQKCSVQTMKLLHLSKNSSHFGRSYWQHPADGGNNNSIIIMLKSNMKKKCDQILTHNSAWKRLKYGYFCHIAKMNTK